MVKKRCKFVGLNFKNVDKITDYKETDITEDVKLLSLSVKASIALSNTTYDTSIHQ